MRRISYLFAPALVFLLMAGGASAQYTPESGSPERKAIMDALRVPTKRELKKNVIFEVGAFSVKDGWAVISATPRNEDGSEFDWSGTKYARCMADGDCDRSVQALLRKRGKTWSVVEYAVGATDWSMGYACQKRKCPKELW